MASRALKNALDELGRWFGVRSADAFLEAVLGGSASPSPGSPVAQGEQKPTPEALRAELLSVITGQGDSAPSVSALLEKIAAATAGDPKTELKAIATDLCITLDRPDYAADADPQKHPLNAPSVATSGKEDKDQGIFKPIKSDKFYTVADYAISDESAKPDTAVHVIQVFPAVGNISVSDTNVVALFMNSIPTLELSRAVPLIDVLVLTKQAANMNSTRDMSLGRHLVGSDLSTQSQVTQDMFVAEDIRLTLTGDEEEEFRTAATMEVFTSPQTMVPVNTDGTLRRNNGLNSGAPLDPFRPFMSLTSLTINSVGTQGMHAYKSADLSLVLHDRTQLGSIIPLVSPGQIQNVRLQITYGWSHPDGSIPYGKAPSPSRLADASSNRFADLINSMRVTELFQVVNSDFNFGEDGSVNINLKLATAGETAVQSVDITLPEIEDAYSSLASTTEEIKKILKSFRTRRHKAGKINLPMALQRATNANSAATLEPKQIKELQTFIKKSKDKDLKAIGKFAKSLQKEVKGVAKSKERAVGKMIKRLKTTPDPYLRKDVGGYTGNVATVKKKKADFAAAHDAEVDPDPKNNGGTSTKFVSLGKLLSYFVGSSLARTNQFAEVQMIFYAFNESASYLYDCNIAQFPIRIVDLEERLKERFSNTGKMSLKQFLQLLDGFFLRDQGAPGYGFGKVYSKREKDNPRKRKFEADLYKKNKDGDKVPNLIAIQDRKEKILRAAYGGMEPEDPGADFKVPQITLRIEAVPMRTTMDGRAGTKAVLKIHVFDQKCNTLEGLKAVLDGFSSNGTCKKISRPAVGKRSSRHGDIYESQLDILAKPPISAIVDPPPAADVAPLLGLEEDYVKKALKGLYLVDVATPSRMKTILTSLFPTFLYGATHSGIISAKVATENNPALATARMVGAASSKKSGGSGIDPGLPMFITPTSLQLETFGCPYFAMGQQYFVDLMTDTQADNFYGVFEVTHNLEAGKFTTVSRWA